MTQEISAQALLEELWAIATARATDLMTVRAGALEIRDTAELTPQQQAAIASIEKSTGGLKVKFYDKLRALELLGKHLGLFDGVLSGQNREDCNLLQTILDATREEVRTDDLPEIQQTADAGHDLVESP